MSERLSVGLFAKADERWIAGVLYLQNWVRTLSSLPGDERPALHLMARAKTDLSPYRELGDRLSGIHDYAYRRQGRKRCSPKALVRSLAKGRWPVSLEERVERSGIDVLFPGQSSLGRDFPVPWIGWIPDFQHKRCPQFFSAKESADRDRQFRQLVDDAPHLVVSSEAAREDLVCWFDPDPARVSICRFCTTPDERWYEGEPRDTADSFGLPEKYLIFPSQFWIHKNHLNLLDALARLKKGGVKEIALVLTGRNTDPRHPQHEATLRSFIEHNDLEENVFYLGLLPRQRQIQLLRRAAAAVQPSYFEGWSMLVEDCRALGKRIYLSEIPIHREQKHPDCVYFDPDSPEELAERIACDWEKLEPGPDPVLELEARRGIERLSVQYARSYMNILGEAAGR